LKKIKIHREGSRGYNPKDILLPQGYVAEVASSGLNEPVHCCFDDEGNCYVVECGHKIDSIPRILKIDPRTGDQQTFFTFPEDQWMKVGAVTGACWHKGYLYVMNTNTLLRIGSDGKAEAILTGLPGRGDHQANYPVIGPDEKIYFGVGSATNCGVVGADNFAYEWLPQNPDACDVPAQDITLVGRNYKFRNVLGDIRETVETGAYVPFGTSTSVGQVIKGNTKCTGAILRCNLDGSNLEVVAWGLRNPYGIAFHQDGRLFATEHGMDERGARYVFNDPDDFYEIKQGEWYGWPDFASGVRLDDPYWGEGGHGRELVLAEFPNPDPPKPLVSFQTHVGSNGVDICRNSEFGFDGNAFVALFGDIAPVTTVSKAIFPAGFKVVRVDVETGQVFDFAVNKIAGPASKLPHEGFERPSHCQFGPDGNLYVVDFGTVRIAPERGGIRMQLGTGTLWRIRRDAGPRGLVPSKPATVPLYLLQGLAIAGGVIGLGWLSGRLLKKLSSRTDGKKG